VFADVTCPAENESTINCTATPETLVVYLNIGVCEELIIPCCTVSMLEMGCFCHEYRM
jgi:hypothetical protein